MSEAKIYIPERGHFSLPRSAAQDDRLSLETRGLLALMLSLPLDWDYTVTGLAVKAGCGREKMRRMVRELEDVGYLAREQAHGERGQFEGNIYVLQETPPLDGFSGNGDASKTTVARKRRQRSWPSTGFRPEQIKEDINIPPYNPPKGDGGDTRKRIAKSTPDWKPERFEGFWKYYPRGEARQAAVRAWDKLKPDDALIDTIARSLEILKATEEWQRGIGIPYASTFLNGRRWTDAEAKRPPRQPPRAQPARRISTPEDGGDGQWVDL